MDSRAGVPHPAPPHRHGLHLPGDAGAAECRIYPAACKESPLLLQSTVTVFEYSSLLTRVICLKTKISSDFRKEQQLSTLLLFGDAVCVVFHILFPFIGCGVVKKGTRCIDHVHGKSADVPVPGCSWEGRRQGRGDLLWHSTSSNRRKERKVLPGRGNGQGSDAPSSGVAMPTEYDAR